MKERMRTEKHRAAVCFSTLFASLLLVACSKGSKAPPSPAPSAALAATVLVASARPVAAGGLAGSLAVEPGSTPCAVVCDRSRELGCLKQTDCASACAEMLAVPICNSELVAALRCFGKHPASGWECGDNGLASIKVGLCDAEQERFVRCFESTAPR
jgi:hypothetical protein